jgi:CRP/FNR family cyclic AMP-dependent transcriptional regulator
VLANTEGLDVTALSQQFKELVATLVEAVAVPAARLEIGPTPHANFRGFDGGQFYVVQAGSIAVRYQEKTVYTLEQGDILLPDIVGTLHEDVAVLYGSDTGATLHAYPALDFMQRVFSEPTAIRLWSRVLIAYAGLMLRITAAKSHQDDVPMPGLDTYEAGEIIIRQGDKADFVFSMVEGIAEVLVDEVQVGRIAEGEIFGAMAALTKADRSATVKAKTACSVLKVPEDQFTVLIRSNPATIHGLLIDMANSIIHLNEQLVGLSSTRSGR